MGTSHISFSEMLWLAGKAFLVALILTPVIRDIFRSFDVVDRPGQRKVHLHPIPRVGGISIAIAYGFSLLTISGPGNPLAPFGPQAWKLLPGAALVFFTGLIDDFFSLKPVFKILGVVAAASVVFWSGFGIQELAGHPLPVWLDFPMTVFWLLLTSNALNLIDGLDGLCAGMGLVATLTLFVAARLHVNDPLAYATLPLAGALFGFLWYNMNPATVFLGDSGALLIGFLLGCYGMIWTQKSATTLLSVFVPLLALSIPLLDASLSVVRRFLRNQPIFAGDQGHIHHRLLELGLSPSQAVWVLYRFAALASACALLASWTVAGKYRAVIILVFCAAVWIGIRQLRYPEFDLAGRLLNRGEFERAMDLKLRQERLASALEKAATDESWWSELAREGKALGLVSIRWIGVPSSREELLIPGTAPTWSLRIPLSETDSVQVEGAFDAALPPVDLIGLAKTITSTFPANRDLGQNTAAVP